MYLIQRTKRVSQHIIKFCGCLHFLTNNFYSWINTWKVEKYSWMNLRIFLIVLIKTLMFVIFLFWSLVNVINSFLFHFPWTTLLDLRRYIPKKILIFCRNTQCRFKPVISLCARKFFTQNQRWILGFVEIIFLKSL